MSNQVDRYTNRGGNAKGKGNETNAAWLPGLWEFEALAQSDRGLALFACSALEESMRHALEALFISDDSLMQALFEDGNAPLMAGSARRKLLRAMGVIGAAADRDISILAKIRNRFGHRTSEGVGQYLHFEEPSIKSMCNSLYLPQIMLWHKSDEQVTHYWVNVLRNPELEAALDSQRKSMPAREKYWRTCYAISTFFAEEGKECGRPVGPRRLLGYSKKQFPDPTDSDPPIDFTQAHAVVQLLNERRPGVVVADVFHYIFHTPKTQSGTSDVPKISSETQASIAASPNTNKRTLRFISPFIEKATQPGEPDDCT